MKKVFQTKFGKPEGNCFCACVASILEIDIEKVPNYQEGDGVWYQKFKKWLRTFDYECVVITCGILESTDYCPEAYGIVSGTSPRPNPQPETGEMLHAVVYFQDKMVHDPHPEGGDITDLLDVIYLIPKFPKIKELK